MNQGKDEKFQLKDSGGLPFGKEAQAPDESGQYLDFVPEENPGRLEEQDANVSRIRQAARKQVSQFTGDKALIEETKHGGEGDDQDPFQQHGPRTIAGREDEYHQGRHRRRELSPDRPDPMAHLGQKSSQPAAGTKRSYRDIIEEQNLNNEQADLIREITKQQETAKRQKTDQEDQIDSSRVPNESKWDVPDAPATSRPPRQNKWDLTPNDAEVSSVRSQSRFSDVKTDAGGQTPLSTAGRWSE